MCQVEYLVEDVREESRPFVSDGSVPLVGVTTRKIPIEILRDTGTTQSLMLKSSLSRGSNSATGEFVVIQRVSNEFVSVPLHRIHLRSNLAYCCWCRSYSAYERRIYVAREGASWWEGNYPSQISIRTGHFR